ncbi:MAG: hypothetical protein CSA22_08480, partial [Deltaproteobacteria bacterium]
ININITSKSDAFIERPVLCFLTCCHYSVFKDQMGLQSVDCVFASRSGCFPQRLGEDIQARLIRQAVFSKKLLKNQRRKNLLLFQTFFILFFNG